MKLQEIKFPIFAIRSESIKTIDGVVFADGKVLDNKNINRDTLGGRRLLNPLKNLYPLRRVYWDIEGLLNSKKYIFIDYEGNIFNYIKNKFHPLKFHKILKVIDKQTCSVLVLEGVQIKFTVKRPPPDGFEWAGIIYNHKDPWLLYCYSENFKKESRRKV